MTLIAYTAIGLKATAGWATELVVVSANKASAATLLFLTASTTALCGGVAHHIVVLADLLFCF
jgi:hypothetical protein